MDVVDVDVDVAVVDHVVVAVVEDVVLVAGNIST